MAVSISYRANYIQTYIWQAVSILLGFASLFVVVPFLSSNKILYGIYSVCTSLTIFFAYADLGFLSAGVKYAAEYYIRGENKEEMKVIGFTAFIMLSVFMVLALVMFFLGLNPKIVIPELEYGTENYHIAQCLLLTLALFCPVLIVQRILSIIFTIRVQDYVYQRFSIVGNIVRIASVFFFFGGGRYMVVEYYVFYQAVSLFVVLSALICIRKYGYSIIEFAKAIRFDKAIFDKVKVISGTSLLMTISMVLYYELDQIFISNFIGIEAVAIYGVAISVLTLVRQFCSLVYSPYASRYNHYVGLGEFHGLSSFVCKMIYTFAPILIIPIVVISLFSKPFIISWVGDSYVDSALLVSLLVLSFTFNCVRDPITSYFIATERNQVLIKYNILQPLIYWLGIIVTIGLLGIVSLAVFKTVAPMCMTIAYWLITKKKFDDKGYTFVSIVKLLWSILIPIILICICRFAFEPFMMYEHTKYALFINIIFMAISATIGLIAAMFFDHILSALVFSCLQSIKNKILKR